MSSNSAVDFHDGEVASKATTDSSSDDDEVLLEPRFKYERVDGQDAKQLLSTQVLTSIAAHVKLVVVGTQMGYVWVMDHLGFVDNENVPVMRPHRSAVTKLAIDEAGNYVMSCANDGKVVISGIGCNQLNHVVVLSVMPRSIAINPSFSMQSSTPMFVIGERNLVLYEKKFFNYKEQTIFRGGEKDGFITQSSWCGYLIAFTCDKGTRIYDRLCGRLISLIPQSHDVDRIRSSRFPPSHCWLSDTQLAIAWADTLTIVMVVCPEGSLVRQAEIHFTWHLDMFCSGVSYLADPSGVWKEIVVFGLKEDCDSTEDTRMFEDNSSVVDEKIDSNSSAPSPLIQLCLLAPETYSTYRLLAEDRLSLTTKAHSQPFQFSMAGVPSYESYFLISPSDFVTASPYCAADTLKWRVENKFLEEAWEFARERNAELDSKLDSQSVGRLMIEHLLSTGKARKAAARIAEVCGASSTEWQWAVEAFGRARLCTLIAEYMPISSPQLDPKCYETVLQAALFNDSDLFKRLVQQWPPHLYRTSWLIGVTLRRVQEVLSVSTESSEPLSTNEEVHYYQALAHLYVHERKFDSALKIYMSLRDQQIFAVIDKYQLFEHVKDQISELMLINPDRALRLLLDNEDSVPATFVMKTIARQPRVQMAYLTKLLSKNEGAEFADQAVQLYAEYDRKKLMPFLRKNEYYHINRALEVCRQKNFVEEMILLLGKSGNHIDALDLMVKKYNQLDKAVEYCQEHDDPDLWEHLIDEVIKTPAHVAQLLNHSRSTFDPLRVIEKIPPSMDIPGLRDALVNVLRNYEARVELQRGCHESTREDVHELLKTFLHTQAMSVAVNLRTQCSICGSSPLIGSDKRPSELRIFSCGHVAHAGCYLEMERKQQTELVACTTCSDSTRDMVLA
ncbi:unnamed protein product [Heligmosomoides polygyrus]|uniref:Vps39_2 domain-containing protein n=1 Tax=Heligmosomoides polygyrus TaxID=6339 RepID=A0A183G2C2_HELPZ|nr:unnamed protein product [Heligmosomoides polygyrus]